MQETRYKINIYFKQLILCEDNRTWTIDWYKKSIFNTAGCYYLHANDNWSNMLVL